VPTKTAAASERVPSDHDMTSAMLALDHCAGGDAEACVAASTYFYERDDSHCNAPTKPPSPLASFSDPERAFRIVAIHCGKSRSARCTTTLREIYERGTARGVETPDALASVAEPCPQGMSPGPACAEAWADIGLKVAVRDNRVYLRQACDAGVTRACTSPLLCDYRDRAPFEIALEQSCTRGFGKACLALVAETYRSGRQPRSDEAARRKSLLTRGCDFGDSNSCDQLASTLEDERLFDKAKVADLRRRACEFQQPEIGDGNCALRVRALQGGFFDKPTFLSLGAVASFANPDARGTLGGEVSFVRWLDDRPGHLTLGGYAQGEYVAGNTGRVSAGFQGSYAVFGIETGYAYQRMLEDKLNQHSLQITPFFSFGGSYIGCRVLVPLTPSGAPIAMLVLGLKVPINVGGPMNIPTLIHWD
jgi:hypothetical protein